MEVSSTFMKVERLSASSGASIADYTCTSFHSRGSFFHHVQGSRFHGRFQHFLENFDDSPMEASFPSEGCFSMGASVTAMDALREIYGSITLPWKDVVEGSMQTAYIGVSGVSMEIPWSFHGNSVEAFTGVSTTFQRKLPSTEVSITFQRKLPRETTEVPMEAACYVEVMETSMDVVET